MKDAPEDEYELHENAEIIDGIPTFDDIIADPYYKAEFDKKVAEALNIEKSHSDVKGGVKQMDVDVQTQNKGEEAKQEPESKVQTEQPAPDVNPDAGQTEQAKDKEETEQKPAAKEMTAEQFALYNETLRLVSKTAKAGIPDRYNAFEDAEVKAAVKQQIMEGTAPDVKAIAESVIERHKPAPAPNPEPKPEKNAETEILSLKAENALLKAGITPERVDAATKLFIAEGGNLDKINEFVASYPEWQRKESAVEYSKAPPVGGKTAPDPDKPPVLNDFQKKVAQLRKQRGYDN